MKFNHKSLLIFDLDGTLIDSVPDLALAVNSMLKDIGRSPFSEVVIRTWVGNGAQTLVKRALSGSATITPNIETALFEKALKIFLDAYQKSVCQSTQPYPNVISTLEALQDQGYRLAIVTNKPIAFVKPILETLHLLEYFEYYIGGDSLPLKKPNALPLLHVCEQFKVSVDNALMVGDSKNDILSANSAGMQSIGVTYGYNYNEPISYYNPTLVVDDFHMILESLKR